MFGATLALFMVAAIATPGMAAAPNPLPQQWWFTTWGVQDRLWSISQGKGVTVAVLDTGVQADIPDLSGVVLPGTNADGGGGDGRTDTEPGAVAGHGTGMASLIAAQGNGTGFVGVAPQAKILPVVATSTDAEAKGIRFAVDQGAKVINISRGADSPCAANLQEAVGYAVQRDVIIVAAAGNNGNTNNISQAPANCAGVLAVGAVDVRFRPWVKTQRQSYVAVAAPGVDVGSVIKDGQFHTADGGTSSATALTSASVALIRSKYPQMSAREVVQRLIASALDAGPKGKDDQTGYGLIRPVRAITQAPSANTPNPVFDAYDKWKAAGAQQGTGSEGSEAAPKRSSRDIVPLVVGFGSLVVIVIVVLLVMRGRNQKRLKAAGVGRHGQPQSFGGPYPPQGGQPPTPGAQQQPYYPQAGQGPQGGQPPQQGQYPPPGQPGQWNAPDQRQ